ncbi:hypothetical protein [Enterococcus saccharolyticus]|uniref:hypothetical protein n=1 Tax=Enterococcus saccharolyticus TaxID=41997 RepID=UPI0039E1B26E
MKKTIDYLLLSIISLLVLLLNVWVQQFVRNFYTRFYVFPVMMRFLPIIVLLITTALVIVIVLRTLRYRDEASYQWLLCLDFVVYLIGSVALILKFTLLAHSVVMINSIYYLPILAGLYLGLWFYIFVTKKQHQL